MKNLIASVVVCIMVTSGLVGCQGREEGQAGSASSSKAISAFRFTNPSASGTIDESTKRIDVMVPPGTNVSGLIATFITDGESVKVGSTTQASGITPNDFTSPAQYLVFAADGSSITYSVHVNIAEKWKIVSTVSFGTAPISKVTFSNEKAYAAYGDEGIRILDISDLSHPLLAGSINSPTIFGAPVFSLYDIVIGDNIACVAAYQNCLGWCMIQYPGPGSIQFYNVENPADPIYLSSVQVGAADMFVDGHYLYSTWADANLTHRLYIIDFSDPVNPFIKSSVQIPGMGRLTKNGNLVYVSTNNLTRFNEIIVVDVSDSSNPTVINPSNSNIYNVAHAPLALFNSFAYIADGTYGVVILDISSANTPTTITTIYDFAPATGVSIAGNYLLVTHGSNTTDIYDLQTPQTPALFKQIATIAGVNTVFVGDGHSVIAEFEKLNFIYH